MDKEQDEQGEKKVAREILTENHHKSYRSTDDMPSQYEGLGNQENTAIGYDALEDL